MKTVMLLIKGWGPWSSFRRDADISGGGSVGRSASKAVEKTTYQSSEFRVPQHEPTLSLVISYPSPASDHRTGYCNGASAA